MYLTLNKIDKPKVSAISTKNVIPSSSQTNLEGISDESFAYLEKAKKSFDSRISENTEEIKGIFDKIKTKYIEYPENKPDFAFITNIAQKRSASVETTEPLISEERLFRDTLRDIKANASKVVRKLRELRQMKGKLRN